MAEKQMKTSIGGAAVMEGVMMRGPEKIAVAVRKPDGEIEMDVKNSKPTNKRNFFLKLPIVRGCVGFFESMVTSTKALMYSAEFIDLEDEEGAKQSKFDAWLERTFGDKVKDIVIYVAVFFALIMSVGLFILLPTFLSSLAKLALDCFTAIGPYKSAILAATEGIIRILIFFIYILSVSFMPEIRRVFQYHGAEHKTIACYEAGEELTVENARTKCRLHPRCGTSFLLIVMVVSIIMFSFLQFNNLWVRIAVRLALLPVVAGVSYEIIKFAGKYDNILTRIISWPGLMFQKITTKEPDDSQLEVAITSMTAVIPENQDEAKW